MDATAQQLLAQLRHYPLDPGILESLRKHCENTGDPSTWAEALEHHARAAAAAEADPVELGRLHFELGNLYRDQLGRSDKAISHYRLAIDYDAAQRAAIAAARSIFAEAGKWDQVAKLLAREADSLPQGPKRAALLREQAAVLRDRLAEHASAIEALREAASLVASDLALQHELSTLLLDEADRASDRASAATMRREAADRLCEMARRVSDDYAIAYIDAALDAVPDHEPALRLLQVVAPRMGRADSIPARWVACLQHAPDGPLARELRLKLAIAYRTAGQNEDAWQCLKPLVERGDLEARALAEGLPSANISKPASPSRQSVSSESSMFALDASDLVEEQTGASQNLFEELDQLRASEPAEDASSPLADLASLGSGDDDETLIHEPEAEAAPQSLLAGDSAEAVLPEDVSSEFEDDDDDAEQLTGSGLEELPEGLRDAEVEADLAGDDDDDAMAAAGLEPIPGEATRSGDEEAEGFEELEELASGAFEHDASLIEGAASGAVALAQEPAAQPSEPGASDEALESAREAELPVTRQEARADEARAPTSDDAAGTSPASDQVDAQAAPSSMPAQRAPTEAAPTQPFGDTPDTNPERRLVPTRTEQRESVAPAPQADAARSALEQAATLSAPEAGRDDGELSEERTQPRADVTASKQAGKSGGSSRSVAPPTPASEPEPEPLDELGMLRRDLQKKLRFRDRRGAAELAERMLGMGVLDNDAITALEDHYRMTRDFRRMRDLALRIAGELEVPVEARIARLREAAMLSESKLGDVDGTAHAWREVLALLPTDEEANNKLRRLLTRLSRWDELCQLLEQRAQAEPDLHDRARRYREIAAVHRERRKAPADAIGALEQARALEPDVAADVVTLTELYISAGRFSDAAAMYEWRVAHTEESVERVPLMVALADLYEQELSDLQAAYTTTEALLQIAPRHLPSLDRLARIDEREGRWDQLIHSLEAKLTLSDAPGRAKLHARIGEIALAQLEDANRAADAYASAIDISADDRALLLAAAPAFERAGRRAELTESMAAAAQHARDPQKRFDLHGMVAERREEDGDLAGAISAREAQLAVRRESTTLQQLVSLLRRSERPAELARRLDELARLEAPERARELRLERAAVLAEQLSNLEAAKNELSRVLDELAPDDTHVLHMLIDLCRRTDDIPRRTEAQERLIKLTPSLEGKVDLVTDLVETFEASGDLAGAIRVLRTWSSFDPGNPQPYLRIAPLLERTGQHEALRGTYDSLAALAIDADEAGEYILRAARVAFDIDDFEGAWNRLVPRVVDAGDVAAEELLRSVAARAGRSEALAELYVGLAQRDEGSAHSQRRWQDAAGVYESMVNAPERALEAVLRAFAKNLDDRELLGEADRLAQAAGAWTRLGQVYDALVKRAPSNPERVAILMRHAKLLEQAAQDPHGALTRASLAFQLEPTAGDVFNEATRLAQTLAEHEQLLGLYERRAQAQLGVEVRIDALLSACACAFVALSDSPRAQSYLARAVVLAGESAALLDAIEERAETLDSESPVPHGRGLVHALTEVYAREAAEAGRPRDLSALLWTHAAHLHERVLHDLDGAYAALELASAKRAQDEGLLDELVALAQRAGKAQALAAHLSQRAETAIESSVATAALWRLGALYQDGLRSPELAAEAYAQLVKLRPNDLAANQNLRSSLQAAGRHKELLLAIERESSLSSDPAARLMLLKEAAGVWEEQLGNRFEALDTWRKVAALVPDDADAQTAIARLRARPKLDESSLLDGDIVVSAEDLRPSLPPTPEASAEGEDRGAEEASAEQNSEAASEAGAEEAHEAVQALGASESAETASLPGQESVAASADDTLVAGASAFAESPLGTEPAQTSGATLERVEPDSHAPASEPASPSAEAASLRDSAPQTAASDSAEPADASDGTQQAAANEGAEPTEVSDGALQTAASDGVEPAGSSEEAGQPLSDHTPAAGAEMSLLAERMAELKEALHDEDQSSELERAAAAASDASVTEQSAHEGVEAGDEDEAAQVRESGAHPLAGHLAGMDPDETMDIDAFEMEEHEEELTAPADLASLSSLIERVSSVSNARGPGGSRVPPPPPAARGSVAPPAVNGSRSAPPPAPNSVRPPPPPRRS